MNLSGYRRWSITCFDKFGETPYALVKCVDGQNTIEMQDITFSLIYCFWKWIGENFILNKRTTHRKYFWLYKNPITSVTWAKWLMQCPHCSYYYNLIARRMSITTREVSRLVKTNRITNISMSCSVNIVQEEGIVRRFM